MSDSKLSHGVIPAKAGIQAKFSDVRASRLDSRLRGNDILGKSNFGALVLIAGLLATASPAFATEWVHCADAGKRRSHAEDQGRRREHQPHHCPASHETAQSPRPAIRSVPPSAKVSASLALLSRSSATGA
jgi:hypothetical protein